MISAPIYMSLFRKTQKDICQNINIFLLSISQVGQWLFTGIQANISFWNLSYGCAPVKSGHWSSATELLNTHYNKDTKKLDWRNNFSRQLCVRVTTGCAQDLERTSLWTCRKRDNVQPKCILPILKYCICEVQKFSPLLVFPMILLLWPGT